jgi:O-antigen/teichoic acid export membrane protein
VELAGKASPFVKDVGLTAIASGLTTVAVIIVTGVLARGLGTDGFGAYSLTRRMIATLVPASTLMMGDAIVRSLASSKQAKDSYIVSGLVLAVAPALLCAVVATPLRGVLAQIIYHGAGYESLLFASIFLVVCYSFYSVLYAIYRGSNRMRTANLWQLAMIGVAPLIAAWWFGPLRRPDLVVAAMAAPMLLSIVPLWGYARSALSTAGTTRSAVVQSARELARYGIPRVPGAMALGALLTIGPALALYVGTLEDAGYLVVGQSLLRVVEGAVVGFDLVMLPKVAQLFAEERHAFLSARVSDVLALVVHIGLFATLQLGLWADTIVAAWLGSEYVVAVVLTRVILLGLMPYLAYLMLRSVLDAVDVRAVNARNLYLSFGLTVVMCLAFAALGLGALGLALGTLAGFACIGVLTIRSVTQRFVIDGSVRLGYRVYVLNGALLVTSAGAKLLLERSVEGKAGVGAALVTVAVLFAVYVAVLRRWNARWLIELRQRLG